MPYDQKGGLRASLFYCLPAVLVAMLKKTVREIHCRRQNRCEFFRQPKLMFR